MPSDVPLADPVDGNCVDQYKTLVELASVNRKEEFYDLARAVGVAPDDLDALWAGAIARSRGRI